MEFTDNKSDKCGAKWIIALAYLQKKHGTKHHQAETSKPKAQVRKLLPIPPCPATIPGKDQHPKRKGNTEAANGTGSLPWCILHFKPHNTLL